MPRVAGVDIPNDKPAVISLQYIFGVGKKVAADVCAKLNINPQIRAKELTEDQLSRIASLLESEYVIEGQLRRQIQQHVARLRDIGCYRGQRHRRGLPVRGQRTKTNARQRRGPKKTVGVRRKATK